MSSDQAYCFHKNTLWCRTCSTLKPELSGKHSTPTTLLSIERACLVLMMESRWLMRFAASQIMIRYTAKWQPRQSCPTVRSVCLIIGLRGPGRVWIALIYSTRAVGNGRLSAAPIFFNEAGNLCSHSDSQRQGLPLATSLGTSTLQIDDQSANAEDIYALSNLTY